MYKLNYTVFICYYSRVCTKTYRGLDRILVMCKEKIYKCLLFKLRLTGADTCLVSVKFLTSGHLWCL